MSLAGHRQFRPSFSHTSFHQSASTNYARHPKMDGLGMSTTKKRWRASNWHIKNCIQISMIADFWTSSLANANVPSIHLLNSAGTSPASSSSTNSSRSHCQSPAASSLRSGPLPPMPLPPPPQAPNMSSFVPQMPRQFQQPYCQSPCLSNASTAGTTVIGGGSEDFPMYGHQQQFMATQRVGCCCCAGCPAHQQQQFGEQRKYFSIV